MTVEPAPAVLVIDDDLDTQANLRDILDLDGYAVETAGSIAAALDRRDWQRYFAIILDRRLPDGTAEVILPHLKELAPDAAVIIVTAYSDLEGAIAALREGAADYILKPVNADLIRSRLAGILERRRTAAEIVRLNSDLQRRVAELQTLLDVIPVGIAIAQDRACEHIHVNPALLRLMPQSPGERPSYRILRNGREMPVEDSLLRQAARGVPVHDVELDVVHADGTVINLLSRATPLCDEQGQPRGAVAVFIDITERKKAEEQLLQKERLAAIGQMITGLAHESGNALARSQSCLEMLAWEVEDRPEALDLITRAQKAQDHLKQLYEEVRGYAAPLKLEREEWDVSAVWRQTWDNLALSRQGRDAALCVDAGGIDMHCSIDPFRLDQVFRNIFENALAACKDPVRITIRCVQMQLGGKPALSVSVKDNGPGLTPEQRQRIFEPFFTTKTKGTGLGMAIARRIVEAHGGQIAVGPAGNGGAEILVTLPRQAP
jgi:PAS domain S-box-containing protein